MAKDKNGKNNADDVTIKEASSKLDISEATVRKYLKDFDLKVEQGSGNKAILLNETFQTLNEIVKLRANGLTIQEIKELKTQKPSKHILDEIEETQELVKSVDGEVKAEADDATDSEKLDLIMSESGNGDSSSVDDSDELSTDIQKQDETIDISKEEESEDRESAEGEESTEGEEQPRRRRGFNFRYVERQISNDSKRVSSIRRRLVNPNISIQEKLFFEEALERRVLMLNGWKHILKWVSKR